jgi:NAD(P)-dependent dehydrogenase (short-subunit alcohol dehydrogenase family)
MGRSHAARLAAEGASVVLVDLNEQGVRRAAEALPAAVALPGDVTRAADAAHAVELAQSTFGSLDILVNNAGGALYPSTSLVDLAEQQWDRVLEVNLKGQWLMARAAIPAMLGRGAGRIINIASTTAYSGDASVGAYAAAKAGVIGLTRSLATQCGGTGITVNAVAPGLIRIAEPKPSMTPEVFDRAAAAWLDRQRVKRTGEVADVSAVVAFFASEEAGFITGQVLVVDGGTVYA